MTKKLSNFYVEIITLFDVIYVNKKPHKKRNHIESQEAFHTLRKTCVLGT